ncbi:acylphosphatase [Bacillus sp. H-16]|uniref:acylphosphatase n=1 Tax=Alteribacter salitolerans TaxID=2912333 RepID=UPI001964E6E5|nr:acylphosphatase [Alteribacter salitolerans]MBM7095816.1 acylphosphatase [Alteribacter salitolerans]
MESIQSISLPHLTSETVKGARKTKLCAYAVALEGWRRGLKLKWYTIDSGKFDNMITFGVNPPGRLFSLSSEGRTHYFFRTRGDKVTNEAVEIGSDKDETKILLSKAGVPVPEGHVFSENVSNEEILSLSTEINFPVVLKPLNGSLGNGVITNIRNPIELKKALKYVRLDLGYLEVIVERYVPGDEYRVYVVEDKVIAAYNRLPARIIGDGNLTIFELIELKNKERKKNPRLFSCLIEIDQETLDFINDAGYDLDSIPGKGEEIYLKEKTNVSAGGDPVDVTDELDKEIKQIAIDAVNAVPGLYHGGVDIIIDTSNPEKQSGVVIELNPTAQIGGILFPVKGRARDIPSAIIDYYFPETKENKKKKSDFYFDLNTVLEPLQSRSAVEVEVSPAPIGKVHGRKYKISGSVRSVRFQKYIKKEALDRNLHGYINSQMDGSIEVIIAGTNKDVVHNFKEIITQHEMNVKIKKITEENWKEPVKVGFEISEGMNLSSIKSVESSLKKMEKEIKKVEKEKRKLEKSSIQIELSNSWKYTSIFRKISTLFNIVAWFKKVTN